MPKFRDIIILLIFLGIFWHFYGETLNQSGARGVVEEIGTDINQLKENPKVIATLEQLNREFQLLINKIQEKGPNDRTTPDQPTPKKPQLDTPSQQVFSIYNVEIGDARTSIEQKVGEPKRSSLNEYGVNWVAYHENYHNFLMIAYDSDEKVAGLYTNQDLLTSTNGLTIGSSREDVLQQLEDPIKSIQKGVIRYQIQNNQEYDIFLIDNSYVTIFYDKHKNNTVTAIQIITSDLEQQKQGFFAEPSNRLQEGFEYQLFDLTNAARVKHGLHPLSWSETARKTAREHSIDMAENDYFGHTNLQGQSPFDRMEEDNISFQMAGENLAMGQPSSIFAHEGLMNSLGHRKNILKKQFEILSVGVAFNDRSQPFYTETFFTKW